VKAVIVIELTTATLVAATPPIVTELRVMPSPEKFVPLIVTDVPPSVVPDTGLIAVTVGVGGGGGAV
jgi:hypothetical protein